MAAIEVEAVVAGLSEPGQPHEVLIDSQRRGSVNGGETRSFDVAPGIHTIKLAVGNYTSPSVKVVVGFGKTSVVCQTTARRRFGVFATPSLQIRVREEPETIPSIAERIQWRGGDEPAPRLVHALAD